MRLTSYLERAQGLDRLTGPVQRVVRLLRPGPVRNALQGVWLGHPLHPVLVQAPAGTWMSASFLDLWPGNEAASRRLVAAGLAVSVPAAVAGWADWSELHEQHKRVGLVHAVANESAFGLYLASLAASGPAAKALRAGGLAALSFGGYLGGHLAYRQSAGAGEAGEAEPGTGER